MPTNNKRFNEQQMIELFGHFYDKRLFIFLFECTWIAQTAWCLEFSTLTVGISISISKMHTTQTVRFVSCDQRNGICHLCHFADHFFSVVNSLGIKQGTLPCSSPLMWLPHMHRPIRYVQKFLVFCLTVNWTHQDLLHRQEIDTPSHKNVTFFYLQFVHGLNFSRFDRANKFWYWIVICI